MNVHIYKYVSLSYGLSAVQPVARRCVFAFARRRRPVSREPPPPPVDGLPFLDCSVFPFAGTYFYMHTHNDIPGTSVCPLMAINNIMHTICNTNSLVHLSRFCLQHAVAIFLSLLLLLYVLYELAVGDETFFARLRVSSRACVCVLQYCCYCVGSRKQCDIINT